MSARAHLLEQLVQKLGMTSFLAIGLIERSLEEVGANPDSATSSHFEQAMDPLAWRLKMYFTEEEVREKVSLVRQTLSRYASSLE